MKNVVKKILLIFLFILIFQFVFNVLKKNHNINYKIKNNKEFTIKEVYKNKRYNFEINVNNYNFFFNYDNKFNKNKKVIEDIKYYEKDNIFCIYPILKNNNYYNIICSKEDKLYYYDYIKNDIEDFVENLEEKGYLDKKEESKSINLGNSKIYQDNIENDTYIYVWKYNGFYSLNNKNVEQLNIFEKDVYLNKLGVQVDKFYVIPNYDDLYDYNYLYIFNMKNNKFKKLEIKDGITNDYYINGIVDDKLYIFDKDNLEQYKINPKKNNYEIVGNKNKDGLYYDGKWQTRNIYDFRNNEITFVNEIKKNKEFDNYENTFYYQDNYYYFKENDFILYDSYTKQEMYLLNIEDIFDIKMINDTLYFIKDNILYAYNMNSGLNMIMEYDELSFNKVNRYAVYKK